MFALATLNDFPCALAPYQVKRRRHQVVPYSIPRYHSLFDDWSDDLPLWNDMLRFNRDYAEDEGRFNVKSQNKKEEANPTTSKALSEWRGLSRMQLDVKDNESEYEIIADVPGVDKDNLHVDVKNNVLTISAERSRNDEVKSDNWTRVERYSGHMSRSFSVPENVQSDKISAELLNGVLHVVLPKIPLENKKKNEWKIDIKGKVDNSSGVSVASNTRSVSDKSSVSCGEVLVEDVEDNDQ